MPMSMVFSDQNICTINSLFTGLPSKNITAPCEIGRAGNFSLISVRNFLTLFRTAVNSAPPYKAVWEVM